MRCLDRCQNVSHPKRKFILWTAANNVKNINPILRNGEAGKNIFKKPKGVLLWLYAVLEIRICMFFGFTDPIH
jgi:hypothetical protein